jgi:hypothetical protein
VRADHTVCSVCENSSYLLNLSDKGCQPGLDMLFCCTPVLPCWQQPHLEARHLAPAAGCWSCWVWAAAWRQQTHGSPVHVRECTHSAAAAESCSQVRCVLRMIHAVRCRTYIETVCSHRQACKPPVHEQLITLLLHATQRILHVAPLL